MWSSHISDIGTSWDMGPRGEGGEIGNFRIFVIFVGFGGPEGFQGVPGGRGYILTEFGVKRRHLDLVHARFHDFWLVLLCYSLIFLCERHTSCVAGLYFCV